MEANFNGLGMSLGNLARMSNAETRSISAENFTGEKGQGGMATQGTGGRVRARAGPGLEDLPFDQRRRAQPRWSWRISPARAPSSRSG